MIITRTPFRISFAGGSTDIQSFYKHSGGAVASASIDKYMYITVNKRFDNTVRVSYSRTEITTHADEIEHPIVREALKKTGISNGIEITSIADIPAGTGLGSSSSFTVGILHALYAFQGKYVAAKDLAAQACEIEIDILKEPIGKQDQYASAFGGFNFIRFNQDDSVYVDPIVLPQERLSNLSQSCLLFFSGISRSASTILRTTEENQKENFELKLNLKKQAQHLLDFLRSDRDISEFGQILHEGWETKKKLSKEISTSAIDTHYQQAIRHGALGGKILGAGGGGFLLLFVPDKTRRENVRKELCELKEMPFAFDFQGSKIVYVE